ncbi:MULTISPECIES: NAD(P)/FAD-dependent oxidoreductase [Acinetobacter]|uniref:NAD(P)/FAD-dependent oxidoreductase n=1 Tax=Acinetobacter TaxID=469 RepID=UPI00044797C9|nr:FAD-binding oxidoreductase [Acinetobacter baumannii]EXE40752.1 FAD dependent oxidoreductase family protein [Acinetobacter baumannii 1546444]MCR0075042.1 FAD-binding oxidoreductase [Acinetobacter baumannii]MDC4271716.1 FAD-binding oxidoreductase [Acinetobacter baumannii]MDC4307982.1 FAD-binding oxidoreductase [Acinetobacter baumannii]MDC4311400.1 FAD-binding oxidoreductase [Acinetobacter baumannii]
MTKVTALPADDQRCAWYHLSPKRMVKPSHTGKSAARWAVIGAGYTGLAAARQLALNFPNDEVILIEAQEVGFGTAGRNAGFAIDLPHDIGAEDYIGDINIAKTTLKLNLLGQSILHDLVKKHAIDCHMRPSGKYQGAVEDRGIKVLEAYQRGLDKLGQEYQVINGSELPSHIGTSFYKKALFTPGTMLVQPSALVKGLAESLPSNVTLYENTAITEVEYGDKVVLKHDLGQITADKLILANNAFGQRFGFSQLKRTMLPVFLYASMTRPLTPSEQAELGGKDFWGVIPSDPFGSTVRRTHDNRILIRNSFSFNPNGKPKPHCLERFIFKHQRSFDNRFPMLPDVNFEYTWSGSLALSQNHKGFFGQLAPNVYGALCCNGLGITRGTVTGTLLADWIAGQRNDLIDFLLETSGPNKVPPEPFLSIGVNATLWWGQRKAGLEE